MNKALGRNIQPVAYRLHLLAQVVLNDKGPHCAVLSDMRDLGPDEAKVDRHRDQSGSRHRDTHFHPLDTVVGQQGNAVALLKAQREQGVSEPACAPVPLTKRQRSLRVSHAYFVGLEPRGRSKDLCHCEQLAHHNLLVVGLTLVLKRARKLPLSCS
jgi:hypothetical protein